MQALRLELAKAYLVKSEDKDNQKPADAKRAESEGRQLLIRVSKVPGEYAEKANAMLSGMGINLTEVAELPTADDPESLTAALDGARELLSVLDQLNQSIQLLRSQRVHPKKRKSRLLRMRNNSKIPDSLQFSFFGGVYH